MSSLLVEASRTMPHPVHQGHTHTSRVQLSVDLDDSVTGEDLVQAAESMLQQADAILEGQTKVLTYNIKESEQCEYLVGEYIKLLDRRTTGPLGNEEEEKHFHNLRDQLRTKGFRTELAAKHKGHWMIPRNVRGGLEIDDLVPKSGGIVSQGVANPSEPAPAASSAEPSSQQSETVAEPARDDAPASESNAATAEPAPAEQAATPSA